MGYSSCFIFKGKHLECSRTLKAYWSDIYRTFINFEYIFNIGEVSPVTRDKNGTINSRKLFFYNETLVSLRIHILHINVGISAVSSRSFYSTVFSWCSQGGGGGGVNCTTGWKFIIVRENENQHSKINLVHCSKLWNWQIQTLLATQFNSKESVDLCSFWKVATL